MGDTNWRQTLALDAGEAACDLLDRSAILQTAVKNRPGNPKRFGTGAKPQPLRRRSAGPRMQSDGG